MLEYNDISGMCPLPTVNLDNIDVPDDGLSCNTPPACRRHFEKGNACREHYERLLADSSANGNLLQCPFGFSSYRIDLGRLRLAVTSILPYPRRGGEKEQALQKTNADSKISVDALRRLEEKLRRIERNVSGLEARTIEGYAFALHEIRKLNRTVKQSSERLCLKDSPLDPERADPQLVAIWKSSEIMSLQFDV